MKPASASSLIRSAYRKRSFSIILVSTVCIALSLSAALGGKGGKGGGGGKKDGGGSKGSGQDLPVSVSFESSNAIADDGKGHYRHGDGKTEAVIRFDTGQLDLNTHNGGGKILRKLFLDLSNVITDQVPGCAAAGGLPNYSCDDGPDALATDVDARLYTLNDAAFPKSIDLVALQPGEVTYGGLAINFNDGCGASSKTPWAVRFLNTQDSNYIPCPLATGSIFVEALDLNEKSVSPDNPADTWRLSPENVSAQASLFSGGFGEPVLREIVQLPFRITVTLN